MFSRADLGTALLLGSAVLGSHVCTAPGGYYNDDKERKTRRVKRGLRKARHKRNRLGRA